jgi:hypothetical protein
MSDMTLTLKQRLGIYWRATKTIARRDSVPLAKDLLHDASHRAPVSGRQLCHWCRAPVKYGATACRKCGRDQSEWETNLDRSGSPRS